MSVNVGEKAPDFSCEDDAGEQVSLKKYQGKKVVLYFYPKDNTPGCTKESQGFRDHYDAFKQLNTEIIGVSRDSVASHKKFKEKYDLPFALLADVDDALCNAYGVMGEKNMYGKKYFGITRTTFLIDEQGVIEKIWPKVKVTGHVEDVLKTLK